MLKFITSIVMIALLTISTKPTNAKSVSLEEIGDYLNYMLPVYAFGLSMNEEGWKGAMQISGSLLSTQLTVESLKVLTQRERPDYEEGDRKDSFPSGHTAAVFSSATFIHKRYGWKRALIPYALATFTGYSRVHADKHHVTDVLAGAAIGSLYSWFISSEYQGLSVTADTTGAAINYKNEF